MSVNFLRFSKGGEVGGVVVLFVAILATMLLLLVLITRVLLGAKAALARNTGA